MFSISRLIVAATAAFLIFSALLVGVRPDTARAVSIIYTVTEFGGGDCSKIGVWNAGSKTCTLTKDLYTPGDFAVQLGSNNVTLDGGGHKISGDGTVVGVYAAAKDNVTIKNVKVDHFTVGIELFATTDSVISDNTVTNSEEGVTLLGLSNSNYLLRNVTKDNSKRGIRIDNSNMNSLGYNTLMNGSGGGIYLNISDLTYIYGNNFVGDANAPDLYGAGNTNVILNQADPIGGNYWSKHDTQDEGCGNADNNRYCDSPYTVPGLGTDNLPAARRAYYFPWYDQASSGAKNWLLMANTIEAPNEYGWFEASIAGAAKTLPHGAGGLQPGQVGPTGAGLTSSLTASFPGVIGGPVEVGYHARMRQMVSQRILWGDSLEEVTGIDASRLSDHYYWSWYDMKSPGFKDWVLVANPSRTETVTAVLMFPDPESQQTVIDYGDIPPGGKWTPTEPGHIGGPVELKAYIKGGNWNNAADRREVIASQRVLTNGDAAFNEVPGTRAEDLSDRYLWTWYDNKSAGAKNWILVANPGGSGYSMDYSVYIHGQLAGSGSSLAAGYTAAVMIPGKMDGPVEVKTFRHNSAVTLKSIVSQRIIWGPSFEEVPGMPYSSLTSLYYWTWYDQASPGVSNWVQVANPDNATSLYYEITIAGQNPGGCSKGMLSAGAVTSCQFPGKMNGPVKVQAWTNDNKAAGHAVLTSQRVLWKGYFNEVMGTALS